MTLVIDAHNHLGGPDKGDGMSQNAEDIIARMDAADVDVAIQEAKRCIELGLVGIKLHPKAQQFSIDDPTVYKIAEHVADVSPDIPIIFDNGKPASPNKLIGDLADVFPGLTFILAHMRGGDFIDVTRAHDNIFIQTTGMPGIDVVQECVDELGADRVMMGSDSPYHSMEEEVRKVEALQLSERDKQMVFGGTAIKVLKI
ncbi:MAG: amidohydrolase family protein [Methanosarcinales archaeon]|nr:amidohydrolase family protein [Methanosarcinales archaeon]